MSHVRAGKDDLVTKRAPKTEASRAKAIVASLQTGEPTSAEIFDAFWRLDELSVAVVRDAVASWMGPLPDLDRLDVATRLALKLPLRPLRLQTLSVDKDADILDLGPVAEDQLRLAGKSWDNVDRAPEERLDGEVEGSFAGTLERRVLADAEAPGAIPLFDVLLFAGDAGVVFAAGTTQKVALIAYGKVELRDQRTRVAIEEALAQPDAFPSAPAPKKKTQAARAKKTKPAKKTKAATKTKAARTAKVKQAPKKAKKSAAKAPRRR
jgi:hypothetical protein